MAKPAIDLHFLQRVWLGAPLAGMILIGSLLFAQSPPGAVMPGMTAAPAGMPPGVAPGTPGMSHFRTTSPFSTG